MQTETALFLFDKIEKWQKLKGEVQTRYRLLYLECKRNLSLIDCLNLEKGDGQDKDLLNIIPKLSTDIIELVFLDSSNRKILKSILNAQTDFEAESKNTKVEKLNSITSVYIKITTLKSIYELNPNGNMLKRINYKTRIKNIQNGLLTLIEVLSDSEDFELLIDTKIKR